VTLREMIFAGLVIFMLPTPALAQEAASGAAASDPTAAVNYQDVRYRYFDLDQGADKLCMANYQLRGNQGSQFFSTVPLSGRNSRFQHG
jgi:hypothetical protein